MKKKTFILLAAGAALAVCLSLFWYGRPQTLVQVLPLAPESVDYCDVQVTYNSGPAYTAQLDEAETTQLLAAFEGQKLRRRFQDLDGVPGGHQSSMDGMARIYLMNQSDTQNRCELMLLGDYLLVNEIARDRARTYTLSGGQSFQEDLVLRLSALCEE